MISERIELTARNTDGYTAFMFACTKGNKDVVKLLLDYPEIIELNSSDNDGEETALILAFQGGHKDIIEKT